MIGCLVRVKADGLCAAFGVDVYNKCERCKWLLLYMLKA